jgi:hypothetical protein
LSSEKAKIIFIKNLFNGLTPSGTKWNESNNYQDGYVNFSGKLFSFGKWKTMYVGCSKTINVGDKFTFRSGGDIHHTNEYIHSSCNDYSTSNNSITSLSSYFDTRVFWIKLKIE